MGYIMCFVPTSPCGIRRLLHLVSPRLVSPSLASRASERLLGRGHSDSSPGTLTSACGVLKESSLGFLLSLEGIEPAMSMEGT